MPNQPAPEPLSYASAESRKAELIADAEFCNLLLNGDVAANAEWKRVVEAISRPPEIPTGREAVVEAINAASGYTLSSEVLQQVREDRPITPEERRATVALWESRQRDPEWVARLNRGDLAAKKEL